MERDEHPTSNVKQTSLRLCVFARGIFFSGLSVLESNIIEVGI